MTVPLDNLYEWLDNSTAGDKIIYRWHPPGSKNLTDLTALKIYHKMPNDTRPIILCHDQEPVFWHHINTPENHRLCHGSFRDYWQVDLDLDQWPWPVHHTVEGWIRSDFPSNHTSQGILLHSEPGSDALAAVGPGWIPVTFWSHAVISQDWYRFAKHDLALERHQHQHDFLIYSRAWTGSREYRLWFLDQIIQRNLQDSCLVRFSVQDQNQHHRDHVAADPKWRCDTRSWRHRFHPNDSASWASASYSARDLEICDIEVILETVIDRVHLTEKTCRALACGKPFLLVAGTNSLAFLRHYGFETFDPWLDESYDQRQDPVQRLHDILDVMRWYQQHPHKTELRDRLQKIADANRRRFFSDGLLQQIQDELQHDLSQAMHRIQQQPALQGHESLLAPLLGPRARDLGMVPSQSTSKDPGSM